MVCMYKYYLQVYNSNNWCHASSSVYEPNVWFGTILYVSNTIDLQKE